MGLEPWAFPGAKQIQVGEPQKNPNPSGKGVEEGIWFIKVGVKAHLQTESRTAPPLLFPRVLPSSSPYWYIPYFIHKPSSHVLHDHLHLTRVAIPTQHSCPRCSFLIFIKHGWWESKLAPTNPHVHPMLAAHQTLPRGLHVIVNSKLMITSN